MNKAQAMFIIDEVLDSSRTETHKNNLIILPMLPDFSKDEITQFEYDYLGFYLTNNPLFNYKKKLSLLCTAAKLKEKSAGEQVVVGGRIATCNMIKTKRDARDMASLVIEDLTGKFEATIFPWAFNKNKEFIRTNALIEIEGKVDTSTFMIKDEEKTKNKVIVSKMQSLEELESVKLAIIKFRDVDQTMIDKILRMFQDFPGDIDVGLELKREKLFAMLLNHKLSYEGLLELEKIVSIERVK